jgi:phosphoribosylamine--glycine ligase
MKNVMAFHAGTGRKGNRMTAEGGRVLGVTALGDTVEKAIETAYKAVAKITWPKVHYRQDIGQKALKRLTTSPLVRILMGSDSDLPVMQEAVSILKKFDIPYEMTVASAHRTPERAAHIAATARERGVKVIIAGAGHAAHLAGALAAQTSLPIIGVPIDSSCLQGLDALLSTVQMPPGVPVATVSIGKSGARNAAILSAQILSTADERIASELDRFKKEMADSVTQKAARLASGC